MRLEVGQAVTIDPAQLRTTLAIGMASMQKRSAVASVNPKSSDRSRAIFYHKRKWDITIAAETGADGQSLTRQKAREKLQRRKFRIGYFAL
jgi:hypothetical protein